MLGTTELQMKNIHTTTNIAERTGGATRIVVELAELANVLGPAYTKTKRLRRLRAVYAATRPSASSHMYIICAQRGRHLYV